MSGFTKGDWYISDEDCDAVCSSSSTALICCMDKFNSDFEANAHLIAAAPNMYELLKSWADSVDCVNDGYQYGLREETDELLKKARGEV